MITYGCGCVNEVHLPSGVLRSVSKCAKHSRMRRDPAMLGEAYYREQGAFDGPHLKQLREALGPFPEATSSRRALEIGCGCSPYAGAIKAAGWGYIGLDLSPWAAQWTAETHGVIAFSRDWEGGPWYKADVGIILAAHVLEHFRDAPGALAHMALELEPGGQLWLVVPDDTDPCNPDHEWFFSPETLRTSVEQCGLRVEAMEVRKYIARENFIYCRAVKP